MMTSGEGGGVVPSGSRIPGSPEPLKSTGVGCSCRVVDGDPDKLSTVEYGPSMSVTVSESGVGFGTCARTPERIHVVNRA